VGVSAGFGPNAAQSNHGEVAKWLSALKGMDPDLRKVPIEELRILAKSGDVKSFTSRIEKYIVTAVKFAAYEIADQNLGKDRTDLPEEVQKCIEELVDERWVFTKQRHRQGAARARNINSHNWATDNCARIESIRQLLSSELPDVASTIEQDWWQHTYHLVQFQQMVDALLDDLSAKPPTTRDGQYDFDLTAMLHYSVAVVIGYHDHMKLHDTFNHRVRDCFSDTSSAGFMGRPNGSNPVPETPEVDVNNKLYYPSHTIRRDMTVPVWDQVVLDVWISAMAKEMTDGVIMQAVAEIEAESTGGQPTVGPSIEVSSSSVNLVTWTNLMHAITNCDTITMSEFPGMASNLERCTTMTTLAQLVRKGLSQHDSADKMKRMWAADQSHDVNIGLPPTFPPEADSIISQIVLIEKQRSTAKM
jgi:hypothetical protein